MVSCILHGVKGDEMLEDRFVQFLLARRIGEEITNFVQNISKKRFTTEFVNQMSAPPEHRGGPITKSGFYVGIHIGLPRLLVTPWGSWVLFGGTVIAGSATEFIQDNFDAVQVMDYLSGLFKLVGPVYALTTFHSFDLSESEFGLAPSENRVEELKREWETFTELSSLLVPSGSLHPDLVPA